jgi:hypothetical protein
MCAVAKDDLKEAALLRWPAAFRKEKSMCVGGIAQHASLFQGVAFLFPCGHQASDLQGFNGSGVPVAGIMRGLNSFHSP